jgi:hypothetical protein
MVPSCRGDAWQGWLSIANIWSDRRACWSSTLHQSIDLSIEPQPSRTSYTSLEIPCTSNDYSEKARRREYIKELRCSRFPKLNAARHAKPC